MPAVAVHATWPPGQYAEATTALMHAQSPASQPSVSRG